MQFGQAAFRTQPSDAVFQSLVNTVISARKVHVEGAGFDRFLRLISARSAWTLRSPKFYWWRGTSCRPTGDLSHGLSAKATKGPDMDPCGRVPRWERLPDDFGILVRQFVFWEVGGPTSEFD